MAGVALERNAAVRADLGRPELLVRLPEERPSRLGGCYRRRGLDRARGGDRERRVVQGQAVGSDAEHEEIVARFCRNEPRVTGRATLRWVTFRSRT